VGQICKFLFASTALGLVFGVGISLLFKYFTAMREDVIKSSILMLGLNYVCYVVTEMVEMSSIFALFVCALCCGHYARYSLSPQARHFVHELAEFLAYLAEAVVFGYFGLTAVRYLHDFCWKLIFSYLACIFLGRLLAVLFMVLLGNVLKRFKGLSLSWRELVVVWLSGCIRGTIAYALILKAVPMDEDQTPEDRVMVTTVLGIVLLNCLLVGGLFPLMMRLLGLQARALDLGASHAELATSTLHGDANGSETGTNPDTFGQFEGEHVPHVLRARRAAHRGWHHLDNTYFKDWLRPADWALSEQSPGSILRGV